MKYIKIYLSAILLCIAMTAMAKGSVKQKVYIFGFSASFNDSIVYFTTVQEVDGYLSKDRNHFLVNREEYSNQLRNFFDNRGQLHRTCVTFYALEKDKAEKRYEKLKAKYTTKSKNKFDVTYLTNDDFTFKTVTPDEGTYFVDPTEAERAAEESSKTKKK